MVMPEKEEDERKSVGQLSKELTKEFEEINNERCAIDDTMGQLLERKASIYRRNRTLWKMVRKELKLTSAQMRLPLTIDDCTGEVFVSDKELSYKERYESLLKMLGSAEEDQP
jgi:hypothetical protein